MKIEGIVEKKATIYAKYTVFALEIRNYMIELEKFRNIPLESSVLLSLTSHYKFPRNKVSALEKRGERA